jgi:hypothetical protein
MIIDRRKANYWKKILFHSSTFSPQISHGLSWNRIRASTVRMPLNRRRRCDTISWRVFRHTFNWSGFFNCHSASRFNFKHRKNIAQNVKHPTYSAAHKILQMMPKAEILKKEKCRNLTFMGPCIIRIF